MHTLKNRREEIILGDLGANLPRC